MSFDRFYKSQYFSDIVSYRACEADLTDADYRMVIRHFIIEYDYWKSCLEASVDIKPILKQIGFKI